MNLVKLLAIFFIALPLNFNFANASEQGNILSTIKPIYSLIANITNNKNIKIIVNDNSIPHDYIIKPSDIKKANLAGSIIYIDSNYETFLSNIFKNSNIYQKSYSIIDIANIELIKLTTNNHDNGHNHGGYDYHIWLDVKLMIKFVKNFTEILINQYPQNKLLYSKNSKDLINRLEILDKKVAKKLAKISNIEILFFHDAYRYYAKSYNLKKINYISKSPKEILSAKDIIDIKKDIIDKDIKCILSENNFTNKIINQLAKKYQISVKIIDPLGFGKKPDKEMYFDLINELTNQISNCHI